MPRLAERYILQSSGNIKMVIGITIEYNIHRETPFSFKGNLSLWRPSIVEDNGRLFLESGTIINDEVLDPDNWFHWCLLK